MSEDSFCSCGYPHRRPSDDYCFKCNSLIPQERMGAAEVIDFPPNFTEQPCACNETVKSSWGRRRITNVTVCNFCNLYLDGDMESDFAYFSDADSAQLADPTKPQYKVITQKDRFFSSKFDPAVIEKALNEYAQEGWVLKQAVTADFGSAGMSRNELILFMEKLPHGENNS